MGKRLLHHPAARSSLGTHGKAQNRQEQGCLMRGTMGLELSSAQHKRDPLTSITRAGETGEEQGGDAVIRWPELDGTLGPSL